MATIKSVVVPKPPHNAVELKDHNTSLSAQPVYNLRRSVYLRTSLVNIAVTLFVKSLWNVVTNGKYNNVQKEQY